MSVWKETDPITMVMRETGLTRLQVLEGIRNRLLSNWAHELARNPKAPKAMSNLNAMIEQARNATSSR